MKKLLAAILCLPVLAHADIKVTGLPTEPVNARCAPVTISYSGGIGGTIYSGQDAPGALYDDIKLDVNLQDKDGYTKSTYSDEAFIARAGAGKFPTATGSFTVPPPAGALKAQVGVTVSACLVEKADAKPNTGQADVQAMLASYAQGKYLTMKYPDGLRGSTPCGNAHVEIHFDCVGAPPPPPVAPAPTAASNPAGRGFWDNMGYAPRGFEVERVLDRDDQKNADPCPLASNFPVIDRHEPGLAISMMSIDTKDKTSQTAKGIQSKIMRKVDAFSKLNALSHKEGRQRMPGYVAKCAPPQHSKVLDFASGAQKSDQRVLCIGLSSTPALTPEQEKGLKAGEAYGTLHNVYVHPVALTGFEKPGDKNCR